MNEKDFEKFLEEFDPSEKQPERKKGGLLNFIRQHANEAIIAITGVFCLGGAANVAGCIDGSSGYCDKTKDDSSRRKQLKQALTLDQLTVPVTQEKAAFTIPGDKTPNIGTFNGKTIMTFTRGSDWHACYYTMGDNIEEALTKTEAQKIILPSGFGAAGGCVIRNNQIMYGDCDGDSISDLVETPDGGLKAENRQILQPNIGLCNKSLAPADNPDGGIGDPLLLGDVPTGLGDRLEMLNLSTHEATLRMDINTTCGTPSSNGGPWTQSVYDNWDSSPIDCAPLVANTMDDLRTSYSFLRIYSADGGYPGDIRNPRIVEDSEGTTVVYEERTEKPNTNPRSLGEPSIHFIKFPKTSTDGGPNPDGGADSDGGNGDDGGAELDGSIDGSIIDPDDGGEPDGSVPPDGGENPANDGGDDHDAGIPEDDGGAPNDDGGAPSNDGGAPREDGGAPRADGGGNRADGGGTGPDGGENHPDGGAPDGSTGGPDGSVNPDDGGTDPDGGADPDAGTTTDAGIQTPDGGMPNGDNDYIGQPPGCSCKTTNNSPSGLASSVLLGIGLIGTRLRRAFKRKK